MPGKMYEYLLRRPLAVAPDALALGLKVAAREPLPDPGPGRPEAVQARKGRPVDGAETTEVQDREGGVRVIPITGPISRYADWFVELCGGTTVEALARDLNAAVNDAKVRAILLYVDSPGGEATGIGELADMIRAANDDRKPVWAYVHGDAASAAYWLASAAGRVVMDASAYVGSIGVVWAWPTRKDNGRSIEFVSSQSPNKRPDVETEGGKAEVQRVVDDMADVFIAAVAKYRDVSPEAVVSDFGAGGILIGAKAVAAGMADAVGSFEGTLADLATEAAERPYRTAAPAAAATEAIEPYLRANDLLDQATAHLTQAADRMKAAMANPTPRPKPESPRESASTSASASPSEGRAEPAAPSTPSSPSTVPARAEGSAPRPQKKVQSKMSWKAALLKKLARDNGDDALPAEQVDEIIAAIADGQPAAAVETAELKTGAVSLSESPEFKAMADQVAALKAELAARPTSVVESPEFKAVQAELAQARHEKLHTAAEAWAGGLVRERRVPPAARTTLASLYMQLARDDQRDPEAKVAFANAEGTTQGSRVAALTALRDLLPTDAERFHAAVGDQAVIAAESVARSENPEHRPPDPANVARLMKMARLDD